MQQSTEISNSLQAPHVISLFAYYLKTGLNAATESDRREWISAQARAAEVIRRGIDPSFHQYLTLQPNANTIASEEMALVQGSKFIKCLIQRLGGSDERVITKQEQQLLTAIESYSTIADIDKFSERVNAELT
jgi:predicted nicotinamide N-methyase